MRAPVRLAVASLLLAVAPAWAAPVRIFAVGHKQRLADAVSYQTFHDKMAALMDAAFPGRAGLVQSGVDDVASHLFPADPTAPPQALVLFPEDAGLMAVFIGSRGAVARTRTTTTAAIIALLVSYTGPFNHYAAKYPGQPAIRTLGLALTDTLYRSFYETYRELAMTHGVWLAAAANLAPARRVEEADDPGLVALLRDPDEPGRTYAYEAVAPTVYNSTYVFAPNGEILVPDGQGGVLESPSQTAGVIRGSANKPYLTPIEQPPPGSAAGLALAFGPVRDVEVLPTPVGRLGTVISKDAWMIDVNDRLATKNAQVILQPEAFSEWAYVASPWAPDIFKEGGFGNLQKHPEFLVNVDASMTGNLFEVTFDGQSAILGDRRKVPAGPLGPHNAWVGQNPDTGFLANGPWILPDPALAMPGLGLAARRALLAAEGVKLLPGSGVGCPDSLAVGACENGYRESVVWTDVTLPDGPVSAPVDPVREAPPHFSPAVRVSVDTVPVAQRSPKVAAGGARVYVVWHEASAGLENVWLAVSTDRGQTFGAPVRVSDNPPGAVAELHPAVAVRGGKVVVVWQEFASGRDDDQGRIRLARFNARGRKRGTDVAVDDGAPGGKWLPVVAFAGSAPVVAWIDERDAGPEGEPLEHVYAARGLAGGRRFAPPVRVDAGTPVPLAAHLDNMWSPAITAVRNTVWIAWADFRNYNWDIFLARSDDRGATFGANVRVDDYPDFERLNERPTVVADRRGAVHVAWTDLRAREADTNVFIAHSTDGGATFGPSAQADDSKAGFDPDVDTPSSQWYPSLALADDVLFLAWQDDRLGNNDIFFATSTDGGATFAPAERVDDTGAGASAQTRPSLAVAGRRARRRCYVAWEDDRDGTSDVWLAHRPCGAP